MNLSNIFLVQLANFFLSFSLLFQWLQLLLVQLYVSGSTFVVSLYINSCSFRLYVKFLYFNFFSASFCTTFLSAGIATSISVHVFSIIIIIIIIEFRPPFPWHYPPINHGLRVVLQTMNMELGLKMWGQLEELIWRGLGSRVPWKVFG